MNSKFAFVIPLRNSSTSKNWNRCVEICKSTRRTACNHKASISDYEVVLVCKDFPEVDEFPDLKIIREDFPDPHHTLEDQHIDKYSKFRTALEYLSKYESLYVMMLDADDLVSNRIASFVLNNNNKVGYYISKGYEYRASSKYIKTLNNFHLVCGSINILFASSISLLNENISNCNLLRFGHHISVDEYIKLGTPLTAISFSAAIYQKDHGENITTQYFESNQIPNKPNINYYIGSLLKKLQTKIQVYPKALELSLLFSLN